MCQITVRSVSDQRRRQPAPQPAARAGSARGHDTASTPRPAPGEDFHDGKHRDSAASLGLANVRPRQATTGRKPEGLPPLRPPVLTPMTAQQFTDAVHGLADLISLHLAPSLPRKIRHSPQQNRDRLESIDITEQ
ncbi:hypothetical protein Franean1_0027 [Parafrankia sp. EAN1pec]|nr:hypothetical protein Franean1_0027 [Frankia sp. EAN1pec]